METKPESGKRVVIFWVNALGKERTSMGFYAAKHTVDADHWEELEGADYCEESDRYFCSEGWVEETWEGEYIYPITGTIVGWDELPRFPAIPA